MNGGHTSGDDLLREVIEDALAVDPSPDFVRRVRTRIAEEPPAALRRPWRLVGGALAAAAVAVFYLTWPAPDLNPPRPPAATVAARPAGGGGLLERPPAVEVSPRPQAVESRVGRSARTPTATARPSTPSREAAGLQALVESIRRGRVDPSEWLDQPQPDRGAPIIIRPIEIEPLSELALLPGERQW